MHGGRRFFSYLCCLCSTWLLVSSAAVNPSHTWRQQVTVEPLLRFPFANFLANPCGLMAISPTMNPALANWPGMVTERPVDRQHLGPSLDETATPAPLRKLADDGTPLADQAFEFLAPLRERYAGRNHTAEERAALAQELQLVMLEAKHLARHIYPPTALHLCDGIQLQSLPAESLLVMPSGELQVDEVYRGMMITAAHLHLMIRDAFDSARFCPAENRAQHQNIRQLTGKMETLMCLMIHSAVGAERSSSSSSSANFFAVAQRVLQSNIHRYYDCSAREIRGCLVVRYADRILSSVQTYFASQQQQQQRLQTQY